MGEEAAADSVEEAGTAAGSPAGRVIALEDLEVGTVPAASVVDIVQVGLVAADSAVEPVIVLVVLGAVESGTVQVDLAVPHMARVDLAEANEVGQVLAAQALPE